MTGLRTISGKPFQGLNGSKNLNLMVGGLAKPIRTVLPRVNLALNPSFENGTLNGVAFSGTGSSGATSTEWSRSGMYSAKSAASGSVSGDFRLNGSSSVTIPQGLIPGKTYRASCYSYCPSAITLNARSRRILYFYAVNGVNFTENFGPQGTALAGVERISHTFTIPADATGIVLGFGVASSTAGAITYIDDILVEETTELRPYFDGATSLDADYRTSWAGTPNNSISLATP